LKYKYMMKRLLLLCFPFLYGVNADFFKVMKEEKIFFLKSPFSYFRYLKDYVIYGITPSEHNCLNFSKLNHHGKSDFITMRKNRLLDKLFNSVDANKILWDKVYQTPITWTKKSNWLSYSRIINWG